MSPPPATELSRRLARYTPALIGAFSFACSDVLSRVVLDDGADVLTIVTARGFFGLALIFAWMKLGTEVPKVPFTRDQRIIALGLGVLFAGNVFLLFKAFEALVVPIAVLTYFVYPLLTGFAAAATGLDRISWRGVAAALVVFFGLGLMIGAHPTTISAFGIVAALGSAICRVLMMLGTRAWLRDANPGITTWYSLISSTVLLTLISLLTLNWQPPESATGWVALVAISVVVTTGILGVYASTVRIGPFQTALFMNLEPLLATIGSAVFLGEVITPWQAAGGAVMIAALVAFQVKR